MSDPVPIRRKKASGDKPGKVVLTMGDIIDEFTVTDWGLSHDNQTLSLWFADGHQEHIILGAGDRYAFYPA